MFVFLLNEWRRRGPEPVDSLAQAAVCKDPQESIQGGYLELITDD